METHEDWLIFDSLGNGLARAILASCLSPFPRKDAQIKGERHALSLLFRYEPAPRFFAHR